MSEEIWKALRVLFQKGGVIELRAITDTTIHSGYFDSPEALVSHALSISSLPEVLGIYVTLNEVNPALLARRANRVKLKLGRKDATTSDGDILRRRWFPIDLDPVRPSGVSSTADEHQEALDRADRIASWLADFGFPEPVRADSGNGAHLLYCIDLANDEQSGDLVRRCLATLDALFSDSTVTVDTANFNPGRIWKLYGTLSRKGDHTPDRPHRMARVISTPDPVKTVPLSLLQRLTGALPNERQGTFEPKRSGPLDLQAWLAAHGLGVRSERPWNGGTLFVLDQCPFSSSHRDGAFAIQFGSGAIFAGCHHQSCGGGSQRWQELRARLEGAPSLRSVRSPSPHPTIPASEHLPVASEVTEVLKSDDPLRTMLSTFALDHEGDETVAECLILSLASRSVVNTNGLHVSVTGESGKGKSHAFSVLLRQVPERFRLKGAMSNKALFYHDGLQPGTVIMLDDTTLSDEMQEVLKGVTTSFREPFIYRTVSRDRKGFVCTIPERCVWWVAKVEGSGDDQVFNRMLTCWIDDSPEQDRRVLARVLQRDQEIPSHGDQERPEVLICRAMWEALGQRQYYVIIPFASRIRFQVHDNRRNPEMLLDLIKANTILRCMQRERQEVNDLSCLIATRDDFQEACRLYGLLHGTAGGQTTKLTKREADLLTVIEQGAWPEFTIPMLQKVTGWSNGNIHKIIHGYMSRGTSYSGLLEKCPAIAFTDRTVVSEEETGLSMRRRTNAYTFDREIHRQWASGGGVWIEDESNDFDGNSGAPSPPLQPPAADAEGKDLAGTGTNDENTSLRENVCGETIGSSNISKNTEHGKERNSSEGLSICVSADIEDNAQSPIICQGTGKSGKNYPALSLRPGLKDEEVSPDSNHSIRSLISAYDYKPLDIQERTPCFLCGKRDSRFIEKLTPERKKRQKDQQDARRICKACYQKAVDRARISAPPLLGVIDYANMEPVKSAIGRCLVCNLEPAVWRNNESGVKLCDVCYKSQTNINKI